MINKTGKDGRKWQAKHYTINYVNEEGKNISIEITWHNFTESYKHKDITIIEKMNNKEISKRVIEVKATNESGPADAKFSRREVKKMLDYWERYSIYRAYRGKSNGQQLKEIKPYQEIFGGERPEPGIITGIKIRM